MKSDPRLFTFEEGVRPVSEQPFTPDMLARVPEEASELLVTLHTAMASTHEYGCAQKNEEISDGGTSV